MPDLPPPDLTADLERAIAERDAWAQELFEANRFAAELVIERQALTDELAAVQARERGAANEAAASQIQAAHRERDQALAERDQAVRERDAARVAHNDAAAMLERITNSTAWRVTGPLRRIMAMVLGRPMQ